MVKTMDVNGVWIEIGIYKGGTLLEMSKRSRGKKTIIGYDTFNGLPSPKAVDLTGPAGHDKGDFGDIDFSEMTEFFRQHHVAIVKGVFPFCAYQRDISFAHLDVDFYESTRASLIYLSRNLAEGGRVVVDDYKWPKTPGVAMAVDECISEFKLKVLDKSQQFQIVLGRPDVNHSASKSSKE